MPAMAMVSSCEQATHSGGCGFCRGLGITLRAGKSKYSPWYSHDVSLNIGISALMPSSHTDRLSRKRRSNGWSSVTLDPSPSPSSTRPRLTRSRVDTRSATRAGWFVVSCTMPWPSRICLVRCDAAARNTSGADECEYSSRKWCSTSQATS